MSSSPTPKPTLQDVNAAATPTLDAAKITAIVSDVQAVGDTILGVLKTTGFATGGVEQGVVLLDLFAALAQKAISAWHEAAGLPITQDSVLALLPDNTPLNLPSDAAPASDSTSDLSGDPAPSSNANQGKGGS